MGGVDSLCDGMGRGKTNKRVSISLGDSPLPPKFYIDNEKMGIFERRYCTFSKSSCLVSVGACQNPEKSVGK